MDVIGKNFKYKFVQNFLNNSERNILYNYCKFRHVSNSTNFDSPTFVKTADSFFYADPLMESLMIVKKDLIENITGKELLPTYSFWRMYTHGANLPKHSDRPSCEISATVNIYGDQDWPIYMDGKSVILKPGDACIYLGMEVEHYRNEYDGDHQAQVFIHYVDKNGIYKEWNLDKRNHFLERKPNEI